MSPVTFIATLTAKPETREELQQLLASLVAPTRDEPGCIRYDFHVDAAEPSVFVFNESWRSQADLDAHRKMPHMRPLASESHRLLSGSVELRHLTMLGGTEQAR